MTKEDLSFEAFPRRDGAFALFPYNGTALCQNCYYIE